MYYLKKSDDAGIRIFKSIGNESPLNEPSRDEIAKTLVLYHQALKTQLDILSQERAEKEQLVQELASLKERLCAVEDGAAEVRTRSVPAARMTGKSVAMAQPLTSKKLGLFRTLIDQNKQLREEISNG